MADGSHRKATWLGRAAGAATRGVNRIARTGRCNFYLQRFHPGDYGGGGKCSGKLTFMEFCVTAKGYVDMEGSRKKVLETEGGIGGFKEYDWI